MKATGPFFRQDAITTSKGDYAVTTTNKDTGAPVGEQPRTSIAPLFINPESEEFDNLGRLILWRLDSYEQLPDLHSAIVRVIEEHSIDFVLNEIADLATPEKYFPGDYELVQMRFGSLIVSHFIDAA